MTTLPMCTLYIVLAAGLLLVIRTVLKRDAAYKGPYEYKSPRRLAVWNIVLMALITARSIITLVVLVMHRNLLQRITLGAMVYKEEFETLNSVLHLSSLMLSASFLASAILFLMWMYRTYCNILAFGPIGRRFSKSWTWIGFVIPILSLWRPYEVAAEIWAGSTPNSDSVYAKADPIVMWWWGSYLVMGGLAQIPSLFYDHIETIDEAFSANSALLLVQCAIIVAAAIAIVFIRVLTQRQEQKLRMETSATLPAAA